MKSFKSTAWLLPQPVLIIGTYDKEGKPNAMNAAWGGQWDMNEIIISLGSHQTTDNLANHHLTRFPSDNGQSGRESRVDSSFCNR